MKMGRFNVKNRDISDSLEMNAQLARRTSEIVTITNEFGETEKVIVRA